MLNKYIMALLFCLTSTVAHAKAFTVNRQLPCDKLIEIGRITESHKETPVWTGRSKETIVTILTINKETESWTLILTDGEFACILDAGQGFKVYSGEPRKQETPPQPQQKRSPGNYTNINRLLNQ